MENDVFDTKVVDYGAFGEVPLTVGEQLFIYRRLQDSFDKALITVVNDVNDVVGYLDRDAATTRILPGLKEGVRFECKVSGDPVDGVVPMQIRSVDQSEVQTILSRQGVRRSRRNGHSPLAGIFDDSTEEADAEIDGDVGEMDEMDEEFDEDSDSDE